MQKLDEEMVFNGVVLLDQKRLTVASLDGHSFTD
jgi:hypothetical protein